MPTSASSSGFVDYLSSRALPLRRADTLAIRSAGLSMALVEHAPSHGNCYEPVEELIISVVLRSERAPVLRDVGYGAHRFIEVPGCVLLTPPGHGSCWSFDGHPLVLHLGVPLQRIADLLDDDADVLAGQIGRAARSPIREPLVAQLATRLWARGHETHARARRFTELGLGMVMALLLQQEEEPAHGASTAERTAGLAPWRLKKAMQLLTGLEPGRSVPELAQEVGLSPDYFSRTFKAATGQPPHRLASELRIERAKALLRSTDLSMTALSLELGFSSPAHFSSQFRQWTGLSPTAWRGRFR